MKYQICFRKEAFEDLSESFNWYNDCRIGLGLDFLEVVEDKLKLIESKPYIQLFMKTYAASLSRNFHTRFST